MQEKLEKSLKWTRNITENLKFLPQIKTLGMIAHSANNLVRNDLFVELPDNLNLEMIPKVGPKYNLEPIKG